ncbi:hypothetical protein CHLNCDRAFT_145302 [Chlorella variabilis]|uniref:Glycoside hydrolase family 5 domain-containing protein n=1 Tax=Chlorella variabilis TaxID=554065 RepID=E1ZE52_CHLVA|nr:hypothetical protein CHLNCDRAFT_145302 [Chlorella variabilis]EFN55972.1 hypothetical protein CHLNCDRAFT_145302 [Chlorella variabilis]|eukprot:XP_005848074.1 hypothetical protein CHLNCDRAFT_145302 [Chlorella variabilis]
MEAYAPGEALNQYCWPDCAINQRYLQDIAELIAYIGAKFKHVQVLLSAWNSKTAWGTTALNWPTAATNALWKQVVTAVGQHPHVWFGVANEPESNYDGAQDAQVWHAMNFAVAAIREQEAALGMPAHIVAVQGTRGWARSLAYYMTHPITAGQGLNVVYETHPYNIAADFQSLFINPAASLPVIIGEFGPATISDMTMAHAETLMQQCNALGLPWLAWTLHMRCPPSLLQDLSNNGCGISMPLQLSDWGKLVKQYL